MEEIELLNKRKLREKHFLQEDGTIRAEIYDDDIHYLKDGKYEEIDNTLIEKNGYYTNKSNKYKVHFSKDSKSDLMTLESGKHYLNIYLKDSKGVLLKNSKLNKNDINTYSQVKYNEIMDGIDFEYNILPNKIKEGITLKNKDSLRDRIVFSVETDLNLEINEDKSISAKFNSNVIFKIDAPYMVDSNNELNDNIYYVLDKKSDNNFNLILYLDLEWLENSQRMYPVVVDPTITNSGENNSVYDTYIYSGDTNIDRNNKDYLKVGVEKVNNVEVTNRALLKFELPTIGTGSQVVSASMNLIGYPISDNSYYAKDFKMSIHRITQSWDENSANWNDMSDKYDSMIENYLYGRRSCTDPWGNFTFANNWSDITRLVKKWYSDTPNYGVMLKTINETYEDIAIPMFYSKNNSITGSNPKPFLTVTYRNQNGLESYLNYKLFNFSNGNVYVNTFNGNITSVFNVINTIGNKLKGILNIIYNTNDVVLNNNICCGIGWKFNYYQTIKETNIEDKNYLEYMDEDGTIHYFKNKVDENGNTRSDIFIDEDGLNLTINVDNNYYIMNDKDDNTLKFKKNNNIGYLVEFKNSLGSNLLIEYNENNQITKITDSNDDKINISYTSNLITICRGNDTVNIYISDNKIIKINKPSGDTLFEYNTNNIITKITDETNLSYSFEYYASVPYRIKKIISYGINNVEGNFYKFEYDYNSTTIQDKENNTVTLIYNDYGTLISASNLIDINNIGNAYGKQLYYGQNTGNVNKLIINGQGLKYVKNYFINGNFDEDAIPFNASDDVKLTISNDCAVFSEKSLKVVTTEDNKIISKSIEVKAGHNYTFSLYLKNNNNIKLGLSYTTNDGNIISNYSKLITPSDEFNRYDISVNIPETAIDEVTIYILLLTNGVAYLDEVQLEEGLVANHYNLIENSDFSDNFRKWTVDGDENIEIVDIGNNIKALKIHMSSESAASITQVINVVGKKDDTFNLSFWYKNKGVQDPNSYNHVIFNFNYTNLEYGSCALMDDLNYSNDNWQYFSTNFSAKADFNDLSLIFQQISNANDLYITNICLFKDIRCEYNKYDDEGNIISNTNLSNKSSSFKYNNYNQLSSILSSNNKQFTYEYDDLIKNRVIGAKTKNGFANKIIYDQYGNMITSVAFNSGDTNNIGENLYRIRLKGRSEYLNYINDNIKLVENNDCKCDIWKVTFNDDYISFGFVILDNKYFCLLDNILSVTETLSNILYVLPEKNDDGSYKLKIKDTDLYLKKSDNKVVAATLDSDSIEYDFYFEIYEENKLFIESNHQYCQSGRFIAKIIDERMNAVDYTIDENSGLTTKVINSSGQGTIYEYNSDKQIKSISNTFNDDYIEFKYNKGKKLNKIICSNREYNFEYDDFYRVISSKIGNKINLVNYTYDDINGNLLSYNYGNNQKIELDYDSLNRLYKVTKENNDIYKYYYNNNGNVGKIISDTSEEKFDYDNSQRLTKYNYNDFEIKYEYNDDDIISKKKYKLDNVSNNIVSQYNDNNSLTNTNYGDYNINYIYDDLNRVIEKNINNLTITNYEFLSNGKRTTNLLNRINTNGTILQYKYDNLNNITHIYENSKLVKKYKYDNRNELVLENDYINDIKYLYNYDNYGNIKEVKKCNLNNYSCISIEKYEYNDEDWQDKLTNISGKNICYDVIGNPISIGDDTILTWKNGKELSIYQNDSMTVQYDYNIDGIRTKKCVNDNTTEYYLEANKIIYEKRNQNVIFYIYSSENDLLGLTYNNNTYFYVKNLQGDIIKLVDYNNNIIATYEYDSWGNIISIKDSLENDVSNDLTHIGNINPFRYRGYYYDVETNLYYLNKRYYSPQWRRFINADSYLATSTKIVDYNMFAYAGNNPINNIDPNGNSLKKILKKISKKIKKIKKTVKNIIKKITTVVKKIATTIKNSFVAEVGVGIGIGGQAKIGNNVGTGASAYDDFNVGISNGQIYNSTTASVGGNLAIINAQASITHIDDNEINDNGAFHDNVMLVPWEVWNCKNTTKEISFGIADDNNLGFDTSNPASDEGFIGLDFDLHFVVGGHIKIGFTGINFSDTIFFL